jgi:hypothetical protein
MGVHAKYIGSGNLFVKDTSGNAFEAGILKEVTYDFASEFKGLKGDQLVDVLVAEIGRTYSLSAKYAQYSSALRDAVEGATVATGSKRIGTVRKTATGSAITVATTDFGSPAGWAFVSDLGVKYAATGQPLKYNSGTLAATGEYKNTAAVYTLGSGDATAQVDINCVYSITAGETATIANGTIGLSRYFAVYTFRQTTQADGTIARIFHHFPAALFVGNKGGGSQSEWSEEDVELKLFPDASGIIGYRSVHVG